MIVGYLDEKEQVVCTDCWKVRVEAGARPRQLLDSEDPNDPRANFSVVDACSACGREVKYQGATALN
jgi:uncharacterized membrane protein